MNKKLLTLFSIIISTIIILSAATYKRMIKKDLSEKAIQSMPQFNFQELNGISFETQDVDRNVENVIINYYHPDCEHCQYMVSEIKKSVALFQRVQFIMITSADSSKIITLDRKYQLSAIPNLKLLLDAHATFEDAFGAATIPSFFVYSKERKLIKKIIGETKIENLLP
jgi:thiol-disulfide isomerase/thioredoxin